MPAVTSFIFRVRNAPSALYKALGCFAENGVNITKLESYQLNGSFKATQFYADIEGSQHDAKIKDSFEKLKLFTDYIKYLGSYPAHTSRDQSLKNTSGLAIQ